MNITLKDGLIKSYDHGMSVYDVDYDLSEGLARIACAGEINGKVVDLRTIVEEDCQLNILTFNDEGGMTVFRHTTSNLWTKMADTCKGRNFR